MSGNAYLIVILIGMVASIATVGTAFYKLYLRAKRKGYNSPLMIPGIMAPCFAGFFGGMILFGNNDELFNTNSYTYNSAWVGESLINFALYFGGTLVASLVLTSLLVTLLPQRSRRVPGARPIRFPWSLAGKCLLATGGVLIILSIWLGWGGINGPRIAFQVLLPVGLYCLWMAKRSKAPNLTDVISADPRAPVLYLRAFAREGESFAVPKLSEKSTYVSAFQSYSGPRGVNFEQYLAPAFSAAIGPLVALGSPEDYAAPDGAARMYAADTDWKDQFRILARRSACIVMHVDQSDNLGWELESIRTDRLQEKFLVLVSPQKKPGAFAKKALAYAAKLGGVTPTTWSQFAQALRSHGYTLDITDPGPGAVIGFDSEGKGKLLFTGAKEPADFVAAVSRAIKSDRDRDLRAVPIGSSEVPADSISVAPT